MARQTEFGGAHTIKKLDAVERYLQAFQTAMKKQHFNTVFFDAFAGTGDLPSRPSEIFRHEPDGREFSKGSVRRALQVEPRFDRFIFVEKMKGKAEELEGLKSEFTELESRIYVICGDANDAAKDFCSKTDWSRTRAVLFLDPFGNQVSFSTLEIIARCNIDLWYLFPSGIGVNRQISDDGGVVSEAEESLDRLFGTTAWRSRLIRQQTVATLFGDVEVSRKAATSEEVTRYMIERMKEIFGGRVLDHWLPLGRGGGHWYSLIFACGNPSDKAWSLASRIARAVMARK